MYSEQVRPGKDQITGDSIAPGAIELRHLSAQLFSEMRQIALHTHSGVKSRRVKLQDLEGYFSKDGFYMYSSDTLAKYRVTISSGALVVTAV